MDSIAFYLSSDSDEEVEQCCERNRLRFRQIRDKSNIFSLSDTEFLSLFRLSKHGFKYLLGALNNELTSSTRSTSISNISKIGATLRFCVQGSYQKSVGQDFLVGMSQSTVSSVLSEVIDLIEQKLCSKWISFRQTNDEKQMAATDFYNRTGFPGVIGCVDGTHINIVRPIESEHLYFNRKGRHSLNTMIVCDHSMRILAVDSKYGGAAHDSLVWSLSSYRRYLQDQQNNANRNYWLLGDSGYLLEPWLITPFRAATEGSREARFNTIHSKTRNIVERTIGMLKARFRCILGARELHYNPKKASQIVNVCCALHNICCHFKVPYEVEIENDLEAHDDLITSSEPNNNVASRIRRNILNSII